MVYRRFKESDGAHLLDVLWCCICISMKKNTVEIAAHFMVMFYFLDFLFAIDLIKTLQFPLNLQMKSCKQRKTVALEQIAV